MCVSVSVCVRIDLCVSLLICSRVSLSCRADVCLCSSSTRYCLIVLFVGLSIRRLGLLFVCLFVCVMSVFVRVCACVSASVCV